ncbi:PQQ-dependent sugar dehydrogenase [Paracoccus stylophorae]|uniref:PQQ-dependent sugar dehydrogenase n=1 Tax=Paracoccus stylophorae TaxID=659350 RepID=A0ABY7SW05_9RHOB|nr:glucose/sorbosone family PQQ-dependent dehydrogenase [Paracoccus stylophorae]WCR11029.1 PQQ-dependent sugar dehydrogenase [Paracoccus stylophorae]
MRVRKALCLTTMLTAAMLLPAVAQQSPDDVTRAEFPLEKLVLAEGLGNPFEIRIGPDGWLWLTERTAGRLSRVNPENGTVQSAFEFKMPAFTKGAQTGVMGFTFHPEFGNGSDQIFVYLSYDDETRTDPTHPDEADPYHRMFNKIVRLDYDEASGRLSNPTDILTGIPANNDHNSGRMEVGPDGLIYLTVGDQGHNQLVNWCRAIESQTLPTADQIASEDHFAYQGKVLRLNLDGSIPEDNPELEGVRSHIFSYGHRNPQGLAFGPDGTLYANEHGPDSDDEINVITAGGNYGWPYVAGQQDDNFYIYARWSDASVPCEQLEPIGPSQGAPDSVPQQKETDWQAPENYVAPIATMFTVTEPLPGCEDFGYFCRPSVGPSSIVYYDSDGVAELSGRLLTTTLKHGSIYALDPAAEEGAEFTRYYLGQNRLRDIEIADDGRTIYLLTDSQGGIQNEEGGGASGLENPGAVLVYTVRETNESVATEKPASDPEAAEQQAESGDAGRSEATAPEDRPAEQEAMH